jgi:hypothetical protein
MRPRLFVMFLVALVCATAVATSCASAADLSVSSTYLSALDNGGGYVEYRLTGAAARELRSLIDDPHHVFPYETFPGDGDGKVDKAEGERFMSNLDDILTKRQIVLRGVKLDNVDVDDNTGLIGTGLNDTRELYIHITFRSHIQYDERSFNISGLELVEAIYGTAEDVPRNITVEERTFIVAAGIASYEKVRKTDGLLFNLRVPMAAVVSFKVEYPVTSPPTARMQYSHSSIVGNPLVLAILMLVFTYLAIKLPKALAKDHGMQRTAKMHWAFLAIVILIWLFYFLGGASVLVWALSIGCLAGIYYLSYQVYAKRWRGLAESMAGIDIGKGLEATALDEAEVGTRAVSFIGTQEPAGPAATASPAYDPGAAFSAEQVVVETAAAGQAERYRTVQPTAPPPQEQHYGMPHQAQQLAQQQPQPRQQPQPQRAPPPQYAPQPSIQPQQYQQPPTPPYQQAVPPPIPSYSQQPTTQQTVPRPMAQPAPPPISNGKNGKPLPHPPPPVKMRCPACQTVFQVPGAPRPMPIQCPGCGRKGMLR